jgi:hypothetical protein
MRDSPAQALGAPPPSTGLAADTMAQRSEAELQAEAILAEIDDI